MIALEELAEYRLVDAERRTRAAYSRDYYRRNRDKCIEAAKARNAQLTPEERERKREVNAYWQTNPSNAASIEASHAKYYEANREAAIARAGLINKEQYAKHREVRLVAAIQKHAKDPRKRMLSGAKARAAKAGLPCTITLDDIVIPTHCPVLGIKLKPIAGQGAGGKDCSPSLDKLVPSLGYVPGNIAVISHRANMIKRNATTREIAKLYRWMSQHIGS